MGRTISRLTTLVLLGSLIGLASAGSAEADDTTPTVKIISPSPLTVHLQSGENDAFSASFNIRVTNDGPAIAAGDFALGVASDRTYTKAGAAPTISIRQVNGAPVDLGGFTVTTVPVTLTVHDQDSTTLTVVLTVTTPTGVAPTTEDLTLTRSPVSSSFIAILVASMFLGVVVLLLLSTSGNRPAPVADADGHVHQATSLIYTESAFSFTDSWATSLGALITALGLVFSTTGVLSSLVPGIDTSFFVAVTIVYGIVLVLGPLLYSAFQQVEPGGRKYGHKNGFRIAAAVTVVAVGGQLSTVGAIVWLSDLTTLARVASLIFLGMAALVVVAYTEMSRRQLWKLPPPAPSGAGHGSPIAGLI